MELVGLEEDVTRGRVDRTLALEAVIWPKPVGSSGFLTRKERIEIF